MSDTDNLGEFSQYLDDINATGPVREKLSSLFALAEKIIPLKEKIQAIFITDIKSGEANKLENAWFFTPKFALESKKFLSSRMNLDIMFYPDSIIRYEIDSINFDYENEESDTDSQMTIMGAFEDVSFNFAATGKNCEYLWEICKNYLKENLLWYEEDE